MDDLIQSYQACLNLPHALFTPIDHADATVAIVYKVTVPPSATYILKICTRTQEYLREVYFLRKFENMLPVPRIIQAIPPKENRHGAILIECLAGSILQITDFTPALAQEIGIQLARIHLHRTSGYGELIAPESLVADPRIYFADKFEENFNECRNQLPKHILEQCRKYYETHIYLLESVDGPCIIHNDFRPGNLIAHNSTLQGIIDWSAARSNFAQEDFCPLEHWEWTRDNSTKESFLTGYATVRPIPDYHDIMPLLRIKRALATIGFTIKRNTWNNRNARMYQFNYHFLEDFFKTAQ